MLCCLSRFMNQLPGRDAEKAETTLGSAGLAARATNFGAMPRYALLGTALSVASLLGQNIPGGSAGPLGKRHSPQNAAPAVADSTPVPATKARQVEASAGPALTVDVAASRQAISPYVYGIDYDQNLISDIRPSIIRWGGDATSEYNWQKFMTNSGSDYYFQDSAQSPTFEQFYQTNQAAGVATLGTIPILGWVADSSTACSFSVKKYGTQICTEPGNSDCGNGLVITSSPDRAASSVQCNDGTVVQIPAGQISTAITQVKTVNPADADVAVTPSFMQSWVAADVAQFGSTAKGGVFIWSLDNEPVWWDGVHQAVHPDPSTYDDIWTRGLAYAQAIKAADPTANVSGPVTSVWYDMFFSKKDLDSGWATAPYNYWDNPVDRLAHGNMDFVAWYLQQFANYEKTNGQRLLDYFEVHGYMPGTNAWNDANGNALTDPASDAARLNSTRVFWDETYNPGTNDYILNTPINSDNMPSNQCVCLIPRMKNWVNTYYPGTKLAITEYWLGAQTASDVNGGLAQADLLGIFGREGVDVAMMWPEAYPNLTSTDPVTYAFRLYRNYDGAGGSFGDTSVSATSADQGQLSIYAAQRTADSALTIMVINKTPNDLSSPVSISNFMPKAMASVYSYSAANMTAVVPGQSQTINSGGFTATFPANSATLYVIDEGAPPKISIAPNPLVLDGGTVGIATVTYSASIPVDVYAGANLFCGGNTGGSCQTGKWVSEGMVFSLKDHVVGTTLDTATARVLNGSLKPSHPR
jgi:Glycoside hydrolase family 44